MKKKLYLAPQSEDISLHGVEMLCTSLGTEEFIYDGNDPDNNYTW